MFETSSTLDGVVSRRPLEGGKEAVSGARLELLEMADGRRLVLKRLPIDGDFLTRGTDGIGRARLLWESGIMAAAATVVDHGVIDFLTDDEGYDIVVMRDLSDALFSPGAPVRADDLRALLAGVAASHRLPAAAWTGLPLCTVTARYELFAPARHAHDAGPNPMARHKWLVDGWKDFARLVPGDVVSAIEAVHRDARPLERALADRPQVLLHGDTKLENLGLGTGGSVLIDWGELTGIGAREVDVCWFVLMNAFRVEASPDELLAIYEAEADCRLEPSALSVAALGSLAQMGFRLASLAPELLAWWIALARPAITAGLAG